MSIPASVKEVEPCVCGCGLGRHLPITGRPCEYKAACGCDQYVRAPQPGFRRIGGSVSR